jgi:hypothetical protein
MKTFNKPLIIILAIVFSLGLSTRSVFAAGPAIVNLGSASNFTVLSETGITNTGSHTSIITGNIGSSPITGAAMDDIFCSEINGTIYGVDAAYVGSGSQTCFMGNPPLSNKTLVDTAVGDMLTAYNDAAARTLPTATELGAGNIGGMTLTPGLYKWSTDVNIPTNVTLSGGANDIWIFQISGNLNIASGASVPAGIKVILSGGAQVSNIFWQVGGVTGATLGTYSTFNGNILSAKQVIIQTGAVLNGRALAQTEVTLDSNLISPSTPIIPITPIIPPTPTVIQSTSGVGITSGGGLLTYGCKDPNATNYNYFSTSNPALCTYTTSTTVTSADPMTIAGCTSIYGYSIVSGLPCNGIAVAIVPATTTPGLPTTGAGINTFANLMLLFFLAIIAGGSGIYLARKIKKGE